MEMLVDPMGMDWRWLSADWLLSSVDAICRVNDDNNHTLAEERKATPGKYKRLDPR